MEIIKRNGTRVDFNPSKIHQRIKKQAEGLKINCDEIFLKVMAGIANGMSTKQLDDLIAVTSESLSYLHPDYSRLAGKVCISRHHKETEDSYIKLVKKLKELDIIDDRFYTLVKDNRDIIQKALDYERDYNFDYFGWSRLKEIYLIKDENQTVLERPQHMYMRVALNTSFTIEEALVYYDRLSKHYISPATPIMINAGTKIGQLASCSLQLVIGDNTPDLLKTFDNICISSSKAEGIGLAVHNLRSKKSPVGKEGGMAGGVLKYVKIVNEGLRFWNQRGKRAGSCAVYIEPWHKDVVDLLEIRLPTGKDELRARDLFTALWIPDNFMEAVKNDTDWYLFCPNDIEKAGLTPLYNLYGAEYEVEYQKAVDLGLGEKVKAKDIWLKILESQIETGAPYMTYKDHVNKKTNQQNIGVIKSSNLCSEVCQVASSSEIAICILSSIPVQKYIKNEDGQLSIDYQLLFDNVRLATRNLNKVIDINNYSVEMGRKGGQEQRAIGIGIQGLADLFAILHLDFQSPEACKINKELSETIYFAALSASNELAKETGLTYDFYDGSPISKGVFQFEMWDNHEDIIPNSRWDWESLRKSILQYGVRNSLVTNQMPTASSAALIGSNEAFEPWNSNIGVRKVIGGEYALLNKYLVKDLEEEGIWNAYMAAEIVNKKGSIQDIPVIPDEIKSRYKTVYEMPQSKLIEMSRDRGYFVDSSQSLNIFMANPTVGKLTSSHFKAWELGLKTGMYYLRSKPIEFKGSHLGIEKNSEQLKTQQEQSDFECFGCSA